MVDERTALFVRIPTRQARNLAARVHESGRTKQDIVSDLLAVSFGDHTTADSDAAVVGGEVLTLPELAAWLKVDEASVVDRAVHGDLPGRRFGTEWRFSRAAVLRWLEGPDNIERPSPGFASPRSEQAAP